MNYHLNHTENKIVLILRIPLISICFTFLTAIIPCTPVNAQTINYDESQVGDYILPDPLVDNKGLKVTSKAAWLTKRRHEILALFEQHVYGKFPGTTRQIHFKVTSVDTKALGGKATRKEITIFFTSLPGSPGMDVLLYLPNHVMMPVPVFMGLNFYGNHTIHSDPKITLSDGWMMKNENYHIADHKATEASRGVQANRWQVDSLIAHGYGIATAYYGDLEADHVDGWKTGIRTTLQNELKLKPADWGAIGAWSWGLSRMMDYLQTDSLVNSLQIAITGHSRLGKAALWAAANDERFAMIISNNSGEGGTSLSRRNFGETIERINTSFPYWFSPHYKEYNKNVHALPVDQHMLLALMAPRPLYIASAEDDLWADPRGEFLSGKNAATVYALFGKEGIETETFPPVETPVGEQIRYHIRKGKHDITMYDWMEYIAFADKHFRYWKREAFYAGKTLFCFNPLRPVFLFQLISGSNPLHYCTLHYIFSRRLQRFQNRPG